jgi:hypothetical protein
MLQHVERQLRSSMGMPQQLGWKGGGTVLCWALCELASYNNRQRLLDARRIRGCACSLRGDA